MHQRPLGPSCQIRLAELGATEELNKAEGYVAEHDQQIHAGHEQQECPGEQCSGCYEKNPQRPAVHAAQHRRS